MSGQEERNRVAIMQELLQATNEMVEHLEDADKLIAGVEARQELMDEYDCLFDDEVSAADAQKIKQLAEEILLRDAAINTALAKFQKETKQDLVSNNNQQKLLGYMNSAVSASGTYMDYKK